MKAERREASRRDVEAAGYYGLPPVKPPHWDWTVSSYIFLAGLAGSSQIIALIGQLADRSRYAGVIRNARLLATTAATAGAGLLVVDLKTPRRWFNMLRILRPRSPMSFGTYILSGFAGMSGIAAICGFLEARGGRIGSWAQRLGDTLQVGAAVTGAGASTYTASLLSATSNPEWASQPRKLGRAFAASSVASAAAALSACELLQGRIENSRRLDSLAAIATAVHLIDTLINATEVREDQDKVPPALRRARRQQHFAETVLGGIAPLLIYGISRLASGRARRVSLLASACVLAGGFLMRHSLLQAGKASTQSPAPYLRFASGDSDGH